MPPRYWRRGAIRQTWSSRVASEWAMQELAAHLKLPFVNYNIAEDIVELLINWRLYQLFWHFSIG